MDTFPADALVIPGHGELSTMTDLMIYHEMLVGTTNFVRAQVAEGRSLQEIQDTGFPDVWNSWAAGRIDSATWIEFIYIDLTRN